MELEQQVTVDAGIFSTKKGDITLIEDLWLTLDKNKMRKSFIKHGSRIYDFSFQNVFEFKPEKVVLDDDF